MKEFLRGSQREGFFIPFIVSLFQTELNDSPMIDFRKRDKKKTESDQYAL